MNAQYRAYADQIEDALDALSADADIPQPLRDAMRYSLLSGGKRLRGVLLLAAAEMAEGPAQEALLPACALEMIHCYSLIHDDLPAMDDDDLRRGKPTNHKVFGEGMAVLAGDGLLSMAFETLLENGLRHPENGLGHLRAIREIAKGAGVRGMVAGQCLDIAHDGARDPAELLLQIHLRKTGALLTAPVLAGLHLGGADARALEAGEAYGRALGLCFQIVDDLLDVEGDVGVLGKQTGMDAARGKLTWPGVYGVEASREEAVRLGKAAVAALEPFGPRAVFLQ
ncbi:MAG TPA: polyprenyl synthetase family protein, partial [Clostridia bacterium]|nr:polyprenyl synthetase family protein [Clostridia bacterium]